VVWVFVFWLVFVNGDFHEYYKIEWGQASVPAYKMSALLTPYFKNSNME